MGEMATDKALRYTDALCLPFVNQPAAATLRGQSILAFGLMVVGLGLLLSRREILARSGVGIVIQALAVVLMIAARVTFGRRSFHAAANPTSGGLVTHGPYRWWRHPIYAAVLYFIWVAALDYRSVSAVIAALLVTLGAGVRMYAEETLLLNRYPDYAAYRARTARVIPFVL